MEVLGWVCRNALLSVVSLKNSAQLQAAIKKIGQRVGAIRDPTSTDGEFRRNII
jgi:hypothetical protein